MVGVIYMGVEHVYKHLKEGLALAASKIRSFGLLVIQCYLNCYTSIGT